MVVDDHPENLTVAKRHLASGGHDVRLATSAERAFELIEDGEPFDLFVFDVVLPGMSGFELCRRLRARPETSET
ncbi:MAG: response regulator, partial [Planctomycetota bacterium]